MRGTSWFAIAVCVACFLIGYLTYLAAAFFVDFFMERAAPCQYTAQACSEHEATPKAR